MGKKKFFKIWHIYGICRLAMSDRPPCWKKACYSKTSSIEPHFLKGIFHQQTAHHFWDKDQYKFAPTSSGKWLWLIILAQYAKVDKKKRPPHNLTFTSLYLIKYIDWSKWFAISRFWLFTVSISCKYGYTTIGIKFQAKIIQYINLHGNVSIILTCYAISINFEIPNLITLLNNVKASFGSYNNNNISSKRIHFSCTFHDWLIANPNRSNSS